MSLGFRRAAGAVIIGLTGFGLAACGGAPSEDELNEKLVELYSSAPEGEAIAQDLADCVAPKAIDQISDDGLETIMDADSGDLTSVDGVSEEDNTKMVKITTECASEVVGG